MDFMLTTGMMDGKLNRCRRRKKITEGMAQQCHSANVAEIMKTI